MFRKLWKNTNGGILIERKVLLIFGVILIFGIGNLMITFSRDYYDHTTQAIEQAGVNTNFKDVIWVDKING